VWALGLGHWPTGNSCGLYVNRETSGLPRTTVIGQLRSFERVVQFAQERTLAGS